MPEPAVVKDFVLNDETVTNSYGFRVLNAGIVLDRFKSNPIILAEHYSVSWFVIGRWENLRVEGNRLMADAVFDMDDEDASKIAGKVLRGYVKGVSIGFMKAANDSDYNFVKGSDGVPELRSCELMEASIVALPSNRAAVKLYANDNKEQLSTEAIKLSLKTTEILLKPNMEKLNLSAATLVALNLRDADNPLAVCAAVDALVLAHDGTKKELSEAKDEIVTLKTKLSEVNDAEAIKFIDGKINDKVLGADQRDYMLKLAKEDLEGTKKLVESMTPRKELKGIINNPGPGATELKSAEDFQKLSQEEQLEFKNNHPEEYKKLFA